MEEIDWRPFDGDPEPTCSCRCGVDFRSHAKAFYEGGRVAYSRKPCPSCGRHDNIRAIRSDWERFVVEPKP